MCFLHDFVILAVIRLARCASEAYIDAGDSAARRPNELAANHALGCILFGVQRCLEGFDQLFSVVPLVVFHDHICKLFNSDWHHGKYSLLERISHMVENSIQSCYGKCNGQITAHWKSAPAEYICWKSRHDSTETVPLS